MTNEERILQMLEAMQADIASIKGTQEEHTRILSEHTTALNTLIEWADDAQVVVKIPFAQAK